MKKMILQILIFIGLKIYEVCLFCLAICGVLVLFLGLLYSIDKLEHTTSMLALFVGYYIGILGLSAGALFVILMLTLICSEWIGENWQKASRLTNRVMGERN